jgi:hypothetical protein
MMFRVVMFSAIVLAAASVPAAAETGDDAGRLVIGQGANSCWAWTRSHGAKAATQGLYTQWVAGFVSGVSWEADDPDILTRMDFDGLMAWMHDYCKANPLAKVTCLYRKLDSTIMVMKSAEDRPRGDAAYVLDGAMDRSVFAKRPMSPQLVIIGGIFRQDPA